MLPDDYEPTQEKSNEPTQYIPVFSRTGQGWSVSRKGGTASDKGTIFVVKEAGAGAGAGDLQEGLEDQIPCVPLVPGRNDNYAA